MVRVELRPPVSVDLAADTAVTTPPASATAAPAPGPRLSVGVRNALLGAGGVATLLALAEVLPRLGIVEPVYLPPVSKMLTALVTELLPSAAFWEALGNTLLTWTLGLAIVVVSGLVVGAIIGSVPALRSLTATTIEFLRPIPSVALIPLCVALFGTSRQATLVLVVYAAFWQIFMQVSYGVRDVDPVARDTARVYRFRSGTVVRQLIWPTTLPYAMTGFRLAASVALILTVTGELIIGTDGIGRLFVKAQSAANYTQMYALIIVAGVLGMLVNLLARRLERHLLHWHPSMRLEAGR